MRANGVCHLVPNPLFPFLPRFRRTSSAAASCLPLLLRTTCLHHVSILYLFYLVGWSDLATNQQSQRFGPTNAKTRPPAVLVHRERELHGKPRDGSNKVTVTKILQLLMILELYLELSYFFSQIFIVATVTEVTKVPKFLT